MIIVAVSGALHSGKSAVAKHLMDKHGFVRTRFAYRLKKMLVDGLGLSWDDVDNPRKKESAHPLLAGRTPRWAMQSLGTEWGRDMIDSNLWISLWRRDMLELYRQEVAGVVVDDLRFPNEVKVISNMGGVSVNVVRPSVVNTLEKARSHASENQELPTTYEVVNDGTLEDLHSKVDRLIERVAAQRTASEPELQLRNAN